MPTTNNKRNPKYKQRHFGKSIFDGNPTLTLNRYWIPQQYLDPVHHVITAYKSGTPFNKAIDQVATIYSDTVNRNKLAEHTLKTIANDH